MTCRRFISIFLALIPSILIAQHSIQGKAIDENGEALPFVSILINDGSTGAFTDVQGQFSIETKEPIQLLTFRYIGYKTEVLSIEQNDNLESSTLQIILKSDDTNLIETVILAGENPADILMRKVIKKRDENNPEKRPSYRCKTYNKVVFQTKPNQHVFDKNVKAKKQNKIRQKQAQRFEEIKSTADERHMFLMETVSERLFLYPDQVQENILLNRVSGFKNAAIVSLANMVQPFSFYGSYLQIIDKDFLNPISPNSPSRYFFSLVDTLYFNRDTTWIVEFHPRKGKVFEGLEGFLHINSNNYAVEKVRAKPSNPNSNVDISIHQAYQFSNGQWFPEQLNFEFEFKKYPAPYVGLKAAGKTYIEPIFSQESPIQADFLPENQIVMLPNAQTRSDSAWAKWHNNLPLTEKEKITYRIVDSIGQKQKFDRLANAMTVISTGLLPVHKEVSLDLKRLLQFNEAEGTRLGIGLSTEQAKPLMAKKRIVSKAYVAYGTEDKVWKYGSSVSLRLKPSHETKFTISTSRDLTEPGALYELTQSSLINRSLYARAVDLTETASLSFSSRLFKGFKFRLDGRSQQMYSNRYSYTFAAKTTDIPINRFRFSETTAYIRYAYNERSKQIFGSSINRINRVPALELAWTRGWKGILGSEYNYNRYVASLSQSTFIRRLGRTNWRVEAGIVQGDVPIQKLFTLNQGTNGFSWFVVPNTFQTLNDTLWLSDKFVNLFFSQEIGPVLYRHKLSSPFLSLQHNLSFASLKNPKQHQNLGFTTATKPVQESGIRLDDLIRINYLNFGYIGLGGAVFYQWNALESDKWEEGLALRFGLRVSL